MNSVKSEDRRASTTTHWASRDAYRRLQASRERLKAQLESLDHTRACAVETGNCVIVELAEMEYRRLGNLLLDIEVTMEMERGA